MQAACPPRTRGPVSSRGGGRPATATTTAAAVPRLTNGARARRRSGRRQSGAGRPEWPASWSKARWRGSTVPRAPLLADGNAGVGGDNRSQRKGFVRTGWGSPSQTRAGALARWAVNRARSPHGHRRHGHGATSARRLKPPVAVRGRPVGHPSRWLRSLAWRDGTRAVRFEPSELLEQPAALVPRPRPSLPRRNQY